MAVGPMLRCSRLLSPTPVARILVPYRCNGPGISRRPKGKGERSAEPQRRKGVERPLRFLVRFHDSTMPPTWGSYRGELA